MTRAGRGLRLSERPLAPTRPVGGGEDGNGREREGEAGGRRGRGMRSVAAFHVWRSVQSADQAATGCFQPTPTSTIHTNDPPPPLIDQLVYTPDRTEPNRTGRPTTLRSEWKATCPTTPGIHIELSRHEISSANHRSSPRPGTAHALYMSVLPSQK